ncbi:methyltransferase domain-containing protein [Pseudenhygromyxa sp. WMMC2535]|uniref:class I SAM-dependent methyltransferase n=1 Tax=Pseudenhygromyxa sp. WMMC2535 TaxID=2712867 RepID=UPI00155603E9|nr:methyltransferase domain-containing protein [Pseudenhygromyxa sp. WMMC2535]NVB40353.1 methyltransferase domain-containing protein [Pseudenhygromyxa sp. WMMC2535]NVB43547.1 methyltransferase domain-containing protein [Pseudenhygromyxa sp. WMMC2535]
MPASADRHAHRDFLNRYYGISRHFYDLTRKYYLFGRDRALEVLLAEEWTRLIEIGVGTGRNLEILHARRPRATFAGLDACDEMLAHTRRRLPWLRAQHGFAEDADLRAPFGGEAPERVLFSYCLSMVADPQAAIANARAALAPGGKVIVVDFCDLDGLPGPAARALRRWLEWFHVDPIQPGLLEELGARLRHGPLRYFVIAELDAAPLEGRERDQSAAAE